MSSLKIRLLFCSYRFVTTSKPKGWFCQVLGSVSYLFMSSYIWSRALLCPSLPGYSGLLLLARCTFLSGVWRTAKETNALSAGCEPESDALLNRHLALCQRKTVIQPKSLGKRSHNGKPANSFSVAATIDQSKRVINQRSPQSHSNQLGVWSDGNHWDGVTRNRQRSYLFRADQQQRTLDLQKLLASK